MTATFDRIRFHLQLEAQDYVRVIFDHDVDLGLSSCAFECLTCGDLLVWVPLSRWWACPSCAFELPALEADRVLSKASGLLRTLQQDVDRKAGRWVLVTWWRWLLGTGA